MARGDERIAAEADAPAEPGESMDVLLQLTLPIVLILAFVVVTEVKTLTDQMWRLKKDIENTATGRLSRERDTTLMELQLQLLYQATDQDRALAPGGSAGNAVFGASQPAFTDFQNINLGSQPVEIGMPVEMVTRRIRQDGDERGMLVYGYKFRPLFAHQAA
jgi:hypothetical protein